MATKEKFDPDPLNPAGDPYYGINGTPSDTQVPVWSAANSRLQFGASGGASTTFVGARVYNSAGFTIANNTSTVLTFDSERGDTDAFHSTVTNTGRLTVPSGKAGWYLIGGSAEWANNATSVRLLFPRVNGTTPISVQGYQAANGALTYQSFMTLYYLAVADFVEVIAYQLSGGNLSLSVGGNYSPEFFLGLLGT